MYYAPFSSAYYQGLILAVCSGDIAIAYVNGHKAELS